jgi:hypothetical protein
MTSALAAEFERRKQSAACKRSRLRRAGLLPPLPRCPDCGAMCTNERWFNEQGEPLCSLCARLQGIDRRPSRKRREVRL